MKILPMALIFIGLASPIIATSISIPELTFESSFEVIGDLTPGKEIEIIFKFELQPDSNFYQFLAPYFGDSTIYESRWHSQAVYDAIANSTGFDTAYIYSDSTVYFFSEPSWKGKLKPNREEVIRIKARLGTTIPHSIIACIKTMCEESPPEFGLRSISCFTTNIFVKKLREYSDSPQPPNLPETTWVNSQPVIIRVVSPDELPKVPIRGKIKIEKEKSE